jgi:hypothetical protein
VRSRGGQPPAAVDERREKTRHGWGWTAPMTGGATTGVPDTVNRRIVARTTGLLERWRGHNMEAAGSIPRLLAELSAQEVG